MHNDQSSSLSAGNLSGREVNLVQVLLCAFVLVLGLALAQAAGATLTIMLTKMIAS